MSAPQISVVVRTYNEERHLGELLQSLTEQLDCAKHEVLVVDSGSTDKTVAIAQHYGARLVTIRKEDFSFGRSLNVGCKAALGNVFVFVSGHCVPSHRRWLAQLTEPLLVGQAHYSYGRQLGGSISKFSEHQLFRKYFPEASAIPQEGFFCNNANAALSRASWERFRFDEALTGLEDLHLAKRMVAAGQRIAYVAEASVFHFHYESWRHVRTRYEREAIALQQIMPEVHVSMSDTVRYICGAIMLDGAAALGERRFWRELPHICMFRLMQFWGVYKGNHNHRKMSHAMKEKYFYPR
jgi:rhamnosyltransferase